MVQLDFVPSYFVSNGPPGDVPTRVRYIFASGTRLQPPSTEPVWSPWVTWKFCGTATGSAGEPSVLIGRLAESNLASATSGASFFTSSRQSAPTARNTPRNDSTACASTSRSCVTLSSAACNTPSCALTASHAVWMSVVEGEGVG